MCKSRQVRWFYSPGEITALLVRIKHDILYCFKKMGHVSIQIKSTGNTSFKWLGFFSCNLEEMGNTAWFLSQKYDLKIMLFLFKCIVLFSLSRIQLFWNYYKSRFLLSIGEGARENLWLWWHENVLHKKNFLVTHHEAGNNATKFTPS